MGWKCSVLIISNVTEYVESDVLKALGFSNYEPIGDSYLESAIYPRDNSLFIGAHKNNLLICSDMIAVECLEPEIGPIESNLARVFPESEICALSLQSVVNHWGYSISKNNIKIRARAGDSESGTVFDFGDPLPEEKDLLDKSKLNDEGVRIYTFEDYPDEPMTEDQVGEEFVFELYNRYFGERLDMTEDLFEVKLQKYGQLEPQHSPENQTSQAKSNKKWWEFW
ncbi:MAG: hypothetical protein NXI20_19335 [bacterium]|nr:hypothetical protein [bacterium]